MELNFRLNMGGEDLVIGIAQDWQTNEVLMVAFMNKEAVEQTLKTKRPITTPLQDKSNG